MTGGHGSAGIARSGWPDEAGAPCDSSLLKAGKPQLAVMATGSRPVVMAMQIRPGPSVAETAAAGQKRIIEMSQLQPMPRAIKVSKRHLSWC